MKKAFFLDRDGIINEVIVRDGIIGSPRHIEELKIIPEAIAFVRQLKNRQFMTILVTNQPDVSRGKMTRYQLDKIHKKIRETAPLDSIELCTSSNDSDFRRKPNPGMLIQSAKKLDIDLRESFILGDSIKDIEAGKRAGVKTILFQTNYNSNYHGIADHNCNTFEEVISSIFRD